MDELQHGHDDHRPNHDLNDVCRRIEKTNLRLDDIIQSLAATAADQRFRRQIGRLQDLLTKILAEEVSQTAFIKSIDDKTMPPSDENIGVDGGSIALKEGPKP